MRKIKIVPDSPFFNNCDITIFDVTDEKEKKRCKIKVEYAEVDVEQMRGTERLSKEAVLEKYRSWIYDVVRYYIIDDWECVGGYDSIMKIIDEKIDQYF